MPIQNTEYRVVFRFSSKCGAGPVPDVHLWQLYQILIFHTTRASDFFWPFWDGFSRFSLPCRHAWKLMHFQGGTGSKENGVVVDWSIADLQSLTSGPMIAEKQPARSYYCWKAISIPNPQPDAFVKKGRWIITYFWSKHSIFYRTWPWHVLLFLAPVYFIALGPAIFYRLWPQHILLTLIPTYFIIALAFVYFIAFGPGIFYCRLPWHVLLIVVIGSCIGCGLRIFYQFWPRLVLLFLASWPHHIFLVLAPARIYSTQCKIIFKLI